MPRQNFENTASTEEKRSSRSQLSIRFWSPSFSFSSEDIHEADHIKAASQIMAIRAPTILATEYEVFLSFRGCDTRQGFTDVLYNHLKDCGIQVFRDDDELAGGDTIDLILDAITNSIICVPIFSKSFASSAWCLREVAKMVELKKVIIPIFYDVFVEDVKLKTPLYVDLLKKQQQKYGREEVEEWEKALVEVARIKGRKLKDDTGFYVFSKQFAAEILLNLGGKQQFTIHRFVEMTDQTETAMNLLDIKSDDVLSLGLYGMGGIGKTTLAKTIFNRISTRYDACSFLANIREERNTKGLEYLQKKLLQDLNPKASSITDCAARMKSSLQMKSVLIVLDDVSEISHIRELIGEPSSFGARSRIIITTRDERVVANFIPASSSSDEGSTKVSPRIARMEIKGMNPKLAMQLFCGHAFGSSSPPPDYLSLSNDVISISAGLPLALEVIGSCLCGMSIQSWIAKISKLKKIPVGLVQEKLMVSYDALEDDEKEIFLDIACSFINLETTYPIYMWEACGFSPNWAVPVLLSMSLVKITDGKFQMHDQLRDLGREIVSIKSCNSLNPREGSRIESYEDTLSALERKQSKEVVSLRLDPSANNWINLTTFENLRLLKVEGEVAVGRFWQLPKNVTWLFICLVDPNLTVSIRGKVSAMLRNQNNSYLMKLAVLNLSRSCITDNWDGWPLIQKLRGLKVLSLIGCKRLTRMPNFSKMVSLEYLFLRDCIKLVNINSSIGKLLKLKHLNLGGCVHLKELPEEVGNLKDLEHINMNETDISTLPDSIGNLKNLKFLSLKSCERLDKLPESIGDLVLLVYLDISSSRKLKELPVTIGHLVKLEYLSLESCEGITKLPDSIGDLTSLVTLCLSRCCQIEELPSSVRRLVMLKKLYLSGCERLDKLPECIEDLGLLVHMDISSSPKLKELPATIGRLVKLKYLSLGSCERITKLPDSIGHLTSLVRLNLSCCCQIEELPSSITRLVMLKKLSLKGCRKIVKLPDDFGNLILKSLVKLDLSFTGITILSPETIRDLNLLEVIDLSLTLLRVLPKTVTQLSHLQTLNLSFCHHIQLLPELPSCLINLHLIGCCSLIQAPDLSKLNQLKVLSLDDIILSGALWPQLGTEPLEFDGSILPNLKDLDVGCTNSRITLRIPSSLQSLTLSDVKRETKLPCLSHMNNLTDLCFDDCWMDEGMFQGLGVGRLESLTELTVDSCGTINKLPDLSQLKCLEELTVNDCKKLVEIPGLGKLISLKDLRISGCDSLEILENMKNLTMLEDVQIHNREKFIGIEGFHGPPSSRVIIS